MRLTRLRGCFIVMGGWRASKMVGYFSFFKIVRDVSEFIRTIYRYFWRGTSTRR
jgi:hypothetical protein